MKLGAQHFFLSKIHLLFTFFQKLFNMHIRKQLITRVEILKKNIQKCVILRYCSKFPLGAIQLKLKMFETTPYEIRMVNVNFNLKIIDIKVKIHARNEIEKEMTRLDCVSQRYHCLLLPKVF